MYENENWSEEERRLAEWGVLPANVLARVMLQLLREHELINNATYIASLKKLQKDEGGQ